MRFQLQASAHNSQGLPRGSRTSVKQLVCIIDDDEPVRKALAGLVRSLGYGVREFGSADAFLATGVAADCHCVVTDIQMPGMSGIDLKYFLTDSERPVPVIMITGRAHPRLEQRAIASGAAAFLRKPFEADALIACLEKILNG